MRPIIFQEAIKWLEEKLVIISKSFTRELHEVIKQFISYKDKTYSRIAECAWYQENVKILEATLARKIPVFEAEYGLSETTPLRLYDSLVPRIRQHRKIVIDVHKGKTMDDYRAQNEARKLKLELQASELPVLKQEIVVLQEKCAQHLEDQKIVDWYIKVLESGQDTKDITKQLATI